MRLNQLKWCFSALLSLNFLGCNAFEPSLMADATFSPETQESLKDKDTVESAHAALLSDEEWVRQMLRGLSEDPQRNFDLGHFATPDNREFSDWVGKSLVAAGLGEGQNDSDISVQLEDFIGGDLNLRLWFSEEFTRSVLEVSDSAQGMAVMETEDGVFVSVVNSQTQLVAVQCRKEPRDLCAFVLTVNWKDERSGLLVLLSPMELVDGQLPIFLFSESDGIIGSIENIDSYIAGKQAEQEESLRILAQKCAVDPLADELGCQEALGTDSLGIQQLVISLCTRDAAEGETMEQCQPRFVQYCASFEQSPFPEAQAHVCEEMAKAGYSLEESDHNLQETGEDSEQDGSPEEEYSEEGEFEEAL